MQPRQLEYKKGMYMYDVSIIIVNYNTTHLLMGCINSIKRYTKNVEYEIIVVDNNSSNENLQRIENIKGISLIRSSENLGFGRANNLGVLHASGRYLFFLNPDTILDNNAIAILVSFIDNSNGVGACGGNLINAEKRPTHSFRRNRPSIYNEIDITFNFALSRIIYGKNFHYNYSTNPLKVAYITGADLMIPRTVWDEVGGFSEAFFMYYEDTELQYRINLAGYGIYNVPDARIVHLESQSFILNFSKEKRVLEGRFVYFHKVYSKLYNRFADISNLFLISTAIVLYCVLGKRDRAEKYKVRKGIYKEEMAKWK